MVALGRDEERARARRITLVATDCDGTLTDAGVYYSAAGEELKRFSMRDGMGVELLRDAGIPTSIVTREVSGIVDARAKKLRIEHLYLGVRDKRAFLHDLCAKTGTTPENVAFFGDDVNDVGAMAAVGLCGAPGDGMADARAVAHYVTDARAGYGAFREFAGWLLKLRTE